MQDLVIFGSKYRDVVKLVEAINRIRPAWRLLGFIDDRPECAGTAVMGYPVLGTRDRLAELARGGSAFFNNVSGSVVNARTIASLLEAMNQPIASLVHPAIDLAHVQMGRGCILPEACCVGSGTTIGDYLVARLRVVISHDVWIGDHVFIGVGAVIGSDAHIETGAFIGAGATVMPGRRIGAHSVIGAGTVVTEDVRAGVTVCSTSRLRIIRPEGRP